MCVLCGHRKEQRILYFALKHQVIGFVTETESVYSAVRTGSLNKAGSALCLCRVNTKVTDCRLHNGIKEFVFDAQLAIWKYCTGM